MSIVNEEYISHYRHFHETKTYGVSGLEFLLHVQCLIAELKPQVLLDYGCGQSQLYSHVNTLGGVYHRYDPAISELAQLPVTKADLLTNSDVLEHVPPGDTDDVIGHMASISQKAFFNIATVPAKAILPNGENAHCNLRSAQEWLEVMRKHFPDAQLVTDNGGFSCLLITWNSCLIPVLVELERVRMEARAQRRANPINRIVSKVKRTLSLD